mmetsp:Transcript_11958/g.28113  ORF Transcript_11958/g.28113 Transcript_11958/m.28113 type:complete len:586 (-) Transcript_11958:2342-4099(-)
MILRRYIFNPTCHRAGARCLCRPRWWARLLDALVAEAAEVEDVAEEEADERGGAEDVGRDERGGEQRVLHHELAHGLVDGGEVEGGGQADDDDGDEGLRGLGVVEDERLLEVDARVEVGQADEVRVEPAHEPADAPDKLEDLLARDALLPEGGLPLVGLLDGAGRAHDLVHAEGGVAEREHERGVGVARGEDDEERTERRGRGRGDAALTIGADLRGGARLHDGEGAGGGEQRARPLELEPHGHRAGEQHDARVRRDACVAEGRVGRGALHRAEEEAGERELARLDRGGDDEAERGDALRLRVVGADARGEGGGHEERGVGDLVDGVGEGGVVARGGAVVEASDEEGAREANDRPSEQRVLEARRRDDEVEAREHEGRDEHHAAVHELAVQVAARVGEVGGAEQRRARRDEALPRVEGAEVEAGLVERQQRREQHDATRGDGVEVLLLLDALAVGRVLREGHVVELAARGDVGLEEGGIGAVVVDALDLRVLSVHVAVDLLRDRVAHEELDPVVAHDVLEHGVAREHGLDAVDGSVDQVERALRRVQLGHLRGEADEKVAGGALLQREVADDVDGYLGAGAAVGR